jgi:hypothetical protein
MSLGFIGLNSPVKNHGKTPRFERAKESEGMVGVES